MNGMKSVLHEKMQSFGPETYKKFLYSEIIYNWSKLVDETVAAQVQPVKIEHGVVFVDVKNSSFKDQLKFFAEEIIDTINKEFGQEEPLVKEIQIAKGFQITESPQKNFSSAQEDKPEVAFEEITLTPEEIKHCEEQAERFSDDKLRQTVLNTLLSQARIQKFRRANGWHKCTECNTLCPPKEIFCKVCKIKAREAMKSELAQILYDKPWLKSQDVQKILLERMPKMRGECSADVIESARTSLIQNVAGHVRYGDEDSQDVLKLVMLEKRLPPDKLTPAIIKRTLADLHFNLSDGILFRRYDSSKSSRK